MKVETKNDYWLAFNERVKFFFDSLRNLGISIGVLKAGQFISSISIVEKNNPYDVLTFVGYLLIGITIAHFVIWSFLSFPTAKSLGIETKRNPYGIQIFLSLIYGSIVFGLFSFEMKR